VLSRRTKALAPPPLNRYEIAMSSRAHTTAAIERRVRRLARPYGVSLLIAQKRNAKIEAHGGYMLRDDDSFKIVFGDKGYEFSASLEEVEEFLLESHEANKAAEAAKRKR
jgi:hypothetical protein